MIVIVGVRILSQVTMIKKNNNKLTYIYVVYYYLFWNACVTRVNEMQYGVLTHTKRV